MVLYEFVPQLSLPRYSSAGDKAEVSLHKRRDREDLKPSAKVSEPVFLFVFTFSECAYGP